MPHRSWLAGNGVLDAGAFERDFRRNAAQLGDVDRALAVFLDALRSAGRCDDATIVPTSDHGALTNFFDVARSRDGSPLAKRLLDVTVAPIIALAKTSQLLDGAARP